MVTVSGVQHGSCAEKKGIRAGDILLSINGHEIRDVLDYRFYMTEKKLVLSVHRGEELLSVTVRKGEYDDLGLEFDSFLMDRQHACRNKCVFCFIDQLPRGMRDTLYFKDDDTRMSFLMGSYVTLTNLTDEDVSRIIEMHLSPLHISVHTTDPELRVKMMKNKNAGTVLSYLRRFADAGITLECQIVLCKGYNDGEALDRTMRDLCSYLPALGSCSVVPCGLTCHRAGLPEIEPFTPEDCRAVLGQVAEFQKKCTAEYGRAVFYCSDEFYLSAGEPFPAGEFYADYPQIENGVGMIASMRDEFADALGMLDDAARGVCRELSIATGTAAYPFLSSLCREAEDAVPGLRVHIYPVRNDFFGEHITVAGLVTGCDLTAQLAGKPLGETLCIPSVMLRHEGDIFLDDMSVQEVSDALGVPVTVVDTAGGGYAFLDALLGKTDAAAN